MIELTARRRVEIGVFARHPLHKFGNGGFGSDGVRVIANPSEFSVSEIGVDGLVTDRVYGHRLAALFGFGHRVMPLDQRLKRATT